MTLPLAVFADYAGLVAACRARRIQLGMSQLEVDDRAGLPSGYCGKIEISATNPGARNSRSIGKDSLPLLLGALGLEMMLSPSKHARGAPSKALKPLADFMAKRGAKGGIMRGQLLPKRKRVAIAKKAARARWAKREPKLTRASRTAPAP